MRMSRHFAYCLFLRSILLADLLFVAISIVKHHDTNFTVVVNPNDGPGNATWPAATYINAVKSINIYPNVRTLGYIDVANATLPNATVRAQIATYAGWANVSDEFAIHGVFFDRAPWKSDKDGLVERYMRNVSATVWSTQGWADEGDGIVVFNAGSIPDEKLMAIKPNITVVFEESYTKLPDKDELSLQLKNTNGTRESFAMLVNSAPSDLGRGGLRKIVERVRKDVEWLYVTDLTEDVYSKYSSFWVDWLDVLW